VETNEKSDDMKNKNYIIFLLFTAIVISSCVSSLYPISNNENDFIFREELLGSWIDKDMKTQLIVQKGENKKYSVTVIEKGDKKSSGTNCSNSDSSFFSCFLVQLGNQYYFDCTPDTYHPQFDCMGEETKSAMLPLHSVFKIISFGKDQLSIAGMDLDSMQMAVDKDKIKIKHEQLSKDHILLTAGAAELQNKILLNKEAAFIFSEPTIFNRKK